MPADIAGQLENHLNTIHTNLGPLYGRMADIQRQLTACLEARERLEEQLQDAQTQLAAKPLQPVQQPVIQQDVVLDHTDIINTLIHDFQQLYTKFQTCENHTDPKYDEIKDHMTGAITALMSLLQKSPIILRDTLRIRLNELKDKANRLYEECIGSIRIYVRVRNFTDKASDKLSHGGNTLFRTTDAKSILYNSNTSYGTFYNVYSNISTQINIFESIKNTLDNLMTVTTEQRLIIFGYGQSGSGKTYTLLGKNDKKMDKKNDGLAPRIIHHLVGKGIDANSISVEVKEEYPKATGAECFGQDREHILIDRKNLLSGDDFMTSFKDILFQANNLRKKARTNFNEESSRGNLQIEISFQNFGGSAISIFIIDLAGSEDPALLLPNTIDCNPHENISGSVGKIIEKSSKQSRNEFKNCNIFNKNPEKKDEKHIDREVVIDRLQGHLQDNSSLQQGDKIIMIHSNRRHILKNIRNRTDVVELLKTALLYAKNKQISIKIKRNGSEHIIPITASSRIKPTDIILQRPSSIYCRVIQARRVAAFTTDIARYLPLFNDFKKYIESFLGTRSMKDGIQFFQYKLRNENITDYTTSTNIWRFVINDILLKNINIDNGSEIDFLEKYVELLNNSECVNRLLYGLTKWMYRYNNTTTKNITQKIAKRYMTIERGSADKNRILEKETPFNIGQWLFGQNDGNFTKLKENTKIFAYFTIYGNAGQTQPGYDEGINTNFTKKTLTVANLMTPTPLRNWGKRSAIGGYRRRRRLHYGGTSFTEAEEKVMLNIISLLQIILKMEDTLNGKGMLEKIKKIIKGLKIPGQYKNLLKIYTENLKKYLGMVDKIQETIGEMKGVLNMT